MMYWIETPSLGLITFPDLWLLELTPELHTQDLQDNALIDSTENITSNFDLVKVYCILNESHTKNPKLVFSGTAVRGKTDLLKAWPLIEVTQ